MAVFRVEKSKDYTVMSNYHLRDTALSLKAKGLLSQMLSLPEGWDYTLAGLAQINKESKDAIRSAVNELEEAGYICRRQTIDENGKFAGNEYIIHELPQSTPPLLENPTTGNPTTEKPSTGNPSPEKPLTENPTELNIDISSKDIPKRKNKKEKSRQTVPELTLEELKPLFVDWLRKAGQEKHWDPGTMNQIYTELVNFYSPRTIKGNKSPPVKSQRGVTSLCNKLMRDSGGDPNVILDALSDAITAGWTTAHPKKRDAAPAKHASTYMEGKRWL